MSAHPPAFPAVARVTAPALTLVERRAGDGVFGIDAADLRWTDAARPGLRMASVTEDRSKGKYLGYIAFETLSSTGLHQHLDTAYSYFLDGGLFDYQGSALRGDMGVNLKGATHDAIAYAKTLAAARLEGPVLYGGPGKMDSPALHSGAKVAAIVNDEPEVMPDININVDGLAAVPTSVARVSRRLIFDGRKGGRNNRTVQLQLLPGARSPTFQAGGTVQIFVIGGAIDLGSVRVGCGGFGIIEEGAQLAIGSEFGALVIAWADGPAAWLEGPMPDLFGF